MFVHVTNSTKINNTKIQPKRKHLTNISMEKLNNLTVPLNKKNMSRTPTISSFIKEKRKKSLLQVNKKSDITVFITENRNKNVEGNKEIVDRLLENIISNDTLNLSNWNASEKNIELWEVLKVFEKKDYAVELLDVSQSGIKELPPEILHIKNLKTLILSNNNLIHIPKEVGIHQQLKYINLNNNKLYELSLYVQALEVLKVNFNKISNISDILFTCKKLQILEISHNLLTTIPDSINFLENLRIIDLSYNSLNVLPVQLSKLKNLLKMNLSNNELKEIPSLKDIRLLEYLNVNNNKIKSLPEICPYGCMKEIHACINNIDKLDEAMLCKLTNLEILEISDNKLVSVPAGIKYIKTFKFLNISNNDINDLPGDLTSLKNMKISFCKQNKQYESDKNDSVKNVRGQHTLQEKEESNKRGDMPGSESESDGEILKPSCQGYVNKHCPKKEMLYQPAVNYFMRSKIFDSSCEDIHITETPPKKLNLKKPCDYKLKNSCPNCSPRFDEAPIGSPIGYVCQPIPMFYYPPFAIPNIDQDCVKPVIYSNRYKRMKRYRKVHAEPKVYDNKTKLINKDTFIEIYSKTAKEDDSQFGRNRTVGKRRVECFKPFSFCDKERLNIASHNISPVSTIEKELKSKFLDVSKKLPLVEKEGKSNILDGEVIVENEIINIDEESATIIQRKVSCSDSKHILDFSNTKLDFISDDIFKEATRLNKQRVNLENNSLTACPIGIILMKEKLLELNLSHNNLHHIQQYLGELINIEILNLNYNKVSNLPMTLKQCKKLKELSLSHNMLCFIPAVIYEIESLQKLNLSHNMIDEVERDCIIKLKLLETLDLSYNHITILPPEISKLKNMNNINLIGNNIRYFTESDLLKSGKEILHLISVKMRNI